MDRRLLENGSLPGHTAGDSDGVSAHQGGASRRGREFLAPTRLLQLRAAFAAACHLTLMLSMRSPGKTLSEDLPAFRRKRAENGPENENAPTKTNENGPAENGAENGPA